MGATRDWKLSGVLGSDDFVEALNDLGGLFWSSPGEPLADPFNRQCSDLANLRPRSFRKAFGFQFEGQGESGPLGLARDGYCDCSAGSFVEDVLTQDQDGPLPSLLTSPNRIKVSPPDIAP